MVVTTEPRWVNIVSTSNPEYWQFCEQVGDLDVWLSPQHVIPIDQKGNGTQLRYEHAVLKFPRIAEKMIAMRVFLWGE